MKKFEVGKLYSMFSIGDRNCVWSYEVVGRTEKTVTLQDTFTGEIKKCRILNKVSEWCGAESVRPLGQYSMCPTLRAEEVF